MTSTYVPADCQSQSSQAHWMLQELLNIREEWGWRDILIASLTFSVTGVFILSLHSIFGV